MIAYFINNTAMFIRNHINGICFGITAVTIMLFGPFINDIIRRLIKRFHWILRYTVFVLLCTVGYTFIAQTIFRCTKYLLLAYSKQKVILIVTTLGIYLILAWIAKEQKAI